MKKKIYTKPKDDKSLDTKHYVQIPNNLVFHKELTANDVRIWCAIKTHENPKKKEPVYPSFATISFLASVASAKTISESLSVLEFYGFLHITNRDKESNLYILLDGNKETKPRADVLKERIKKEQYIRHDLRKPCSQNEVDHVHKMNLPCSLSEPDHVHSLQHSDVHNVNTNKIQYNKLHPIISNELSTGVIFSHNEKITDTKEVSVSSEKFDEIFAEENTIVKPQLTTQVSAQSKVVGECSVSSAVSCFADIFNENTTKADVLNYLERRN